MNDPQKASDGVDIMRLADAVKHRVWLVVLCVIVVPMIVLGAQRLAPRHFKAVAEVYVEDSVAVNPFLEDMRVAWTVKSRLPVIQAVIKSRDVLISVLIAMGDLSADSSAEETDDAVRDFRRRITVFGKGGGLVAIHLRGGSPNDVHQGLDLLVAAFIDQMLRPQKQAMDEATVFLEHQLKRVRESLEDLEGQLQRFKESNASELPAVYRINLDTYMKTQQELLESRSTLEGKRREVAALSEQLRVYDPVVRNGEAEQIRAESEWERLKTIYTDDHPLVAAASSRVRELRAQRKRPGKKPSALNLRKLESIADSSAEFEQDETLGTSNVRQRSRGLLTGELLRYKASVSEVRALESKVGVLRTRSDELMATVKSHARNERQLSRFERDITVKLKVYQSLLQKYEDAKVTRELALAEEKHQVWVIQAPTRPTTPTNPHWVIFLLGGLAGGVALGLTAALALEFLDRRIAHPDDIHTNLDIPVFGLIPGAEQWSGPR